MRHRVKRGRAGRAAALALLALAFSSIAALALAKPRSVPLVIEVIREPQALAASAVGDQRPRVLLYHTHTWEAYEMTADTSYTPTETWRTKDDRYNMVRVGERLAAELEMRGFVVVHDATDFEPPNLSSAYSRSLGMLDARLDAGESYDYILDVHRDAYSGPYNGGNSIEIEGRQTAHVMLLVGKGTGATGAGFDERPDWPKNLELAQQITARLNELSAGVAREVKIKTGRFNQHVSTGALLIEVGNNKNTLDEALNACPLIAQALFDVHAARAR